MSTITVASTAALELALKTATPGETILLAPGTYSGVTIKNENFSSGVTIASQSTTNQAIVTDLSVSNSSGLIIRNLTFSESSQNYTPVNIQNSSNVSISNVYVHGPSGASPANYLNDGLEIANSSGVSVTSSQFYDVNRGIVDSNSSNVNFTSNVFNTIGSDGVDLVGASNVVVQNNNFTNFFPTAADHPDAIQMWTGGTTSDATNITISGNVISQGIGAQTQGIFLKDDAGNRPFQNVTISGNTITNETYNGIVVDGANNVNITNNVVTAGTVTTSWIEAENVTNANLVGNNSANYLFINSANVVVLNNKIAGVLAPDAITSSTSAALPATSHTLVLTGIGKDTGTGNSLNDTIVGNNAGDVLNGGTGNDVITGGTGSDTITPGSGSDTLTGGGGNDTFIFGLGSYHDTITDFGHTGSHDVINLAAFVAAGLHPTVQDVGANTVISFSDGATITLLGVSHAYLTSTSTGFTH